MVKLFEVFSFQLAAARCSYIASSLLFWMSYMVSCAVRIAQGLRMSPHIFQCTGSQPVVHTSLTLIRGCAAGHPSTINYNLYYLR